MKRNKGITLIALVITIIVLLILAGVTLTTLTGKNGLLNKAKNASEEYEVSSEKEQVDIAQMSLKNESNINEKTWEDLIPNTTVTKVSEKDYIIKFNDCKRLYWAKLDNSSIYIGKDKVNEFEEIDQDGTEAKPYVINTIEDLVDFSNNVRNRNII